MLELDIQGRDHAAQDAAAVRRLGPLSGAVIPERAKSFCNEACFTIALQHRRLKTTEPEDGVFVFRWHADLQFLIVALRRLRDRRQHTEVRRDELQSSSWDGTVFTWLGVKRDINVALKAAEVLFAAVSKGDGG